jgi:hypothetical protein
MGNFPPDGVDAIGVSNIRPERKLNFQRCRGLVFLYTGSQIAIIKKEYLALYGCVFS